MPSGRNTDYLSEFVRALSAVATRLEGATEAALTPAPTKEIPALEAVIRRRLPKFPEELLLLDKAMWLTDSRFVSEPLLWPLAAQDPSLDFLIRNTILGPAGQIWRETAQTHEES